MLRAKTHVEAFVQRNTFGSDSSVVVRIGARPTSAFDLSDSARLRLLAALPAVRLPAPQPSPDTWATLRQTCFSALDGGSFPGSLKGREPEWLNQRAVLEDARWIAPPPNDAADDSFRISAAELKALGLSSDEPATLRPFDARSCKLFEAVLHQAERDIVAASMPQSGQAASAGSNTDSSPLSPEDSRRTLAQRFDDWKSRRARTLLWLVSSHLSDAQDVALKEIDRAKQSYDELTKEIGAADGEWTKVRRRWLRSTRIAAVVFGALLLGIIVGFAALTATIGLVLVGALLFALFVIPIGMLRTARQLTRLEFRLRQIQSAPERALEQRNHAAVELARLEYLNHQFNDWAEVIAIVVHRPWGKHRTDEPSDPWTPESNSHVFTVANPILDEDMVSGEVVRLRRELTREGWITATYARLESHWRARYERLTGG